MFKKIKEKFQTKQILKAMIILSVLALVVAQFQSELSPVTADVLPVSVNVGHLDFGTTFPGEKLQGNFRISYSNSGQQSLVDYHLTKKIKPKAGAVVPAGFVGTASDYCQSHSTDYQRCYRDLCPFLDEASLEGEGDLKSGATVGLTDISDTWTVYYSVPAIYGYVAQQHDGGIVTTNGEYGCDIVVNLDEDCSISGYKFNDANHNANWDGGETGINAWKISLSRNGQTIASTTTDSSGFYCFRGLTCGNYTVTEETKSGWSSAMATQRLVNYTANAPVSGVNFGNYTTGGGPVCGNGVKEGTEQCDGTSGVGAHQRCSTTCQLSNLTYCGDNIKQTPNQEGVSEECDGTDKPAGRTCSATCTLVPVTGPVCGNNIKEGTEECDGTDKPAGRVCSSICQLSPITGPYCGNNRKENTEECDGTDKPEGRTCSATCTLAPLNPVCGNGVKESGEECDGSSGVTSGYTCNSQCKLTGGGGGCVSGCGGGTPDYYCGDGIKQNPNTRGIGGPNNDGKEECDGKDGVTTGYHCSTQCALIKEGVTYCGDGIKQTPNDSKKGGLYNDGMEQCDKNDGLLSGYTCNSNCTFKPVEVKVLGEEGKPVLTIDKDVLADFINSGEKDIKYKITVNNKGNLSAFDLTVKDILPAGLKFKDSATSTTKTWTFKELKPGQSLGIDYLVDANENLKAGEYVNKAETYAVNHPQHVGDNAKVEVKKVEVLGVELIKTGFSFGEFAALVSTMLAFLSSIIYIKGRQSL